MTDPLGLIGRSGGIESQVRAGAARDPEPQGPAFKQFLREQLERVNALQEDAREAVEDLAAGKRDDLESVIVATQKADTAFRMLLQVRNKMMDAYEEVKQMRV